MKINKTLIISSMITAGIIAACSDGTIGSTEITKWQDGKNGAVSITYDDGTINQFRVAVPIMNRLGIPGTFYINTGTLPGSTYTGRFIGRPVSEIIEETKTVPTNAENFFERASAIRFSGYRGTGNFFTRAGAALESGRMEQAIEIINDAYARIVDGEFEPETPRTEGGQGGNRSNVLTWDMVRTHAAEGHEFASHMVTHPYMGALDDENMMFELEKSREEILNQVGLRHTFTAELPYGTQDNRALEAALNIYATTRNRLALDYVAELHRPDRRSPVMPEYEYVFWERGIITRTTMEEMNGWVDITAENDNIWLVTVLHGIDGIGWESITGQTADEHFSYIRSREKDLWVATFADASRYILLRMNSTIKSSQFGGTINVTVSHPFDDKELYELPLTFKTYVNPKWNEVRVTQGNSETRHAVQREGSDAYVMYQAMPGKEKIKIRKI